MKKNIYDTSCSFWNKHPICIYNITPNIIYKVSNKRRTIQFKLKKKERKEKKRTIKKIYFDKQLDCHYKKRVKVIHFKVKEKYNLYIYSIYKNELNDLLNDLVNKVEKSLRILIRFDCRYLLIGAVFHRFSHICWLLFQAVMCENVDKSHEVDLFFGSLRGKKTLNYFQLVNKKW